MLILPRNLAALVKAASTDNPRYAMAAVRLLDKGEGEYLAEATNGKILARVEGRNATEPKEFPPVPALAAAPNSGTETLVNSDDWTRAFSSIPSPKKRNPANTIYATAAVIGEKLTTFGAVNKGTVAVTEAERPDGRYPATNEVFPKSAHYAFAVDPALLIDLLTIAREYTDDASKRVTFEVRDSETPIVIRCRTLEERQSFTGVVMPLALDDKTKAKFPDLAKKLAETEKTAKQTLADLASENRRLQDELAACRLQLTAGQQIAEDAQEAAQAKPTANSNRQTLRIPADLAAEMLATW